MDGSALAKIREDVLTEVSAGVSSFGMIGANPAGIEIATWFAEGLPRLSLTWFGDAPLAVASAIEAAPLAALADHQPPVVIVAEDEAKERVIRSALPHLAYAPKLIVAGYGHFRFHDETFNRLLDDLLVPSIANGYPNTLVHLYQCLGNAARLGLEGAVVEFGVFKGGTTRFLAKTVESLGQTWPVVGFDTFGGFPPRRSALDMYDHPGAEFHDFDAVLHYLDSPLVELVRGDIAETASQLAGRPVVVAFIDTDNFTSASAAVAVLRDNVVPGGAIVFDHLTGVDRFRYTLGERMAAAPLFEDPRYFNLHATGVFLRQQ